MLGKLISQGRLTLLLAKATMVVTLLPPFGGDLVAGGKDGGKDEEGDEAKGGDDEGEPGT